MKEISFVKLKKMSREDMDGYPVKKIALLGDCATQHLKMALQGYGPETGFKFDIFDADYDQIDAQLMDSGSEFYQFSPDYAVIFMCAEKLWEKFVEMEDPASLAAVTFEKIKMNWDRIHSGGKTRIIQILFSTENDRVYGNYGCSTERSFIYQIRKLNFLLMENCKDTGNVFLVDLEDICASMGRKAFRGGRLYYLAKMPLQTEALARVAAQIADIICAAEGRVKKCVICDLDQTLWGGIIGDDGIEGIEIGDLGNGHAYEDLQRYLKELKKRGIILAVCSKNDEDIAKEPFLRHPDMVLRLEDFSVFIANWEDKVSNIRRIRDILNISYDSIVFLDDNPFERTQVREMLPEVTVPDLPEDPAGYTEYLRSLNLFETIAVSDTDSDRTRQYQAEEQRTIELSKYENYDEYLKSLDMVAEAAPFDRFHFPRIAQLSQRSNQFNLRTVRMTEEEVSEITESDKYLTLYFTLRDRFGDHGLISIVILEKLDTDTLFMYNWLMSCRVLKRGMEEFIVNSVMETAKEHGFKRVIGEYRRTAKNAMVEDIYVKMGFTRLENGLFEADTDVWENRRTYITRTNDLFTEENENEQK